MVKWNFIELNIYIAKVLFGEDFFSKFSSQRLSCADTETNVELTRLDWFSSGSRSRIRLIFPFRSISFNTFCRWATTSTPCISCCLGRWTKPDSNIMRALFTNRNKSNLHYRPRKTGEKRRIVNTQWRARGGKGNEKWMANMCVAVEDLRMIHRKSAQNILRRRLKGHICSWECRWLSTLSRIPARINCQLIRN